MPNREHRVERATRFLKNRRDPVPFKIYSACPGGILRERSGDSQGQSRFSTP